MHNDIRLRRARLTDKDQLADLFEASIRGIAPQFCTREQIEAWAMRKTYFPKAFETHFCELKAWVAEDTNTGVIMAYIDLRINPQDDGHIGFFYARKEITRIGITKDLYGLLETHARKLNVPRLYTEASHAAKRFFTRRGFVETQQNDIYIGDVLLQNFTMEKLVR